MLVSMVPHAILAVPEAEGLGDGIERIDAIVARAQSIADEMARLQPVDWEEDLDHGGGPCLALGAERRASSR